MKYGYVGVHQIDLLALKDVFADEEVTAQRLKNVELSAEPYILTTCGPHMTWYIHKLGDFLSSTTYASNFSGLYVAGYQALTLSPFRVDRTITIFCVDSRCRHGFARAKAHLSLAMLEG